MPLPPTPLTITGQCNCSAIKYSISIPALSARPHHAFSTPQNPVTLPMVAIDHCNDCRRATGDIMPIWLCTPIAYVTASVLLKSSGANEERTPYLPANEIFKPGKISDDSYLTFDSSSPRVRRSFCSRCGTNLSFAPVEMPDGWPDRLDFCLGSVDRKCLDGEALRPERILWWEYGVEWVKTMSVRGLGDVPRHRDFHVDEVL